MTWGVNGRLGGLSITNSSLTASLMLHAVEVGVADLESVIDNTASTTAVSSFDHATSSLTSQQRQVIESNETYVSPPNPYLEDEGLEMEIEAEPKNPCLIEMWIDSSVVLVDCFEGVVNHDKLNTVDIIGVSVCVCGRNGCVNCDGSDGGYR